MNESISKEEFERLLSQPRLLRSIGQDFFFCRINDKNVLEVVGNFDGDDIDFSTEANKNFDHIIDDKERAEAYKDLADQLENIIEREKTDNLKNLNENSKFIREPQESIEKEKNESRVLHEQLLNSKEIINQ